VSFLDIIFTGDINQEANIRLREEKDISAEG